MHPKWAGKPVVRDGSGENSPHKLSRVAGSVSGLTMLCQQQEGDGDPAPPGQCDSHCLPEQNGWDPL